jgi:acyl-CoA thioesterase
VSTADIEFLGIRIPEGDGPALLPVTESLCTPFGWLYGGSGIAACAVAATAAARRPLVWITTQYVANAKPGDVVRLDVELVVEGRATTQTHVHGTVDGRTILHATTAHTSRPEGELHWWGEMPQVTPPEGCTPLVMPFDHLTKGSFVERMERFVVPELPELIPQGRAAMWVRVPGWPIGSPASQGFVADIIPYALALASGQPPGGTSLDNTIRVVLEDPTDDWILLDIEAEGLHRSIGCGRVRLWRRDGTLIGVGTQSAIIRTSHHGRVADATTATASDPSA